MGIIVGLIVCNCPIIKRSFEISSSIYRNIGLAFFFFGNGVTAGYSLNTHISPLWIVYGVAISGSSLIVGDLLVRFLLNSDLLNRMCVISGGMTSTPAVAGILAKIDDEKNLSSYSIAYIGALLMIVVVCRYL